MPDRESDRNQTRNITRTEFAVRQNARSIYSGVVRHNATINHEFNFPPARSRARGAHKNRTNARSRAANFSDNQPLKPTLPSRVPSRPLVPLLPLSPFLLSLSLSVFSLSFLSFLPLSPSRHCGTCSTRLHAHIRTHITYLHRALSRKSCSTGAFFFCSLLPVPATRSFSLLSSRSLALSFPSLLPLSLPFKRSPFTARSSSRPGPGSFLARARACPGVTTRSLDIASNFPLDFPTSSRHRRQFGRVTFATCNLHRTKIFIANRSTEVSREETTLRCIRCDLLPAYYSAPFRFFFYRRTS